MSRAPAAAQTRLGPYLARLGAEMFHVHQPNVNGNGWIIAVTSVLDVLDVLDVLY